LEEPYKLFKQNQKEKNLNNNKKMNNNINKDKLHYILVTYMLIQQKIKSDNYLLIVEKLKMLNLSPEEMMTQKNMDLLISMIIKVY